MTTAEKISFDKKTLCVPDQPVIPYIEGDGIGPDIWRACVRVLDRAVDICWQGTRRIAWKEVLAGEKAFKDCDCLVAIGTRFSEIPTGSFGMKVPDNLIHIDINPEVFNNISAEICDGDIYTLNGQDYTIQGIDKNSIV